MVPSNSVIEDERNIDSYKKLPVFLSLRKKTSDI